MKTENVTNILKCEASKYDDNKKGQLHEMAPPPPPPAKNIYRRLWISLLLRLGEVNWEVCTPVEAPRYVVPSMYCDDVLIPTLS